MPYKDASVRKLKNAEYSRKYYQSNKEKIKVLTKANKKVGRVKWSTFKNTLKCTQCGFKHPAALDFHHTNPAEKENLVSKLVSDGRYRAAMKEVKKCIVLCANCHRVHHYEENKLQSL